MLETVRRRQRLLPIDTAGRVLELMLMLDQEWREKQLGQYKLVLLHHMAHNVCDCARRAHALPSGGRARAFERTVRMRARARATMWGAPRCGAVHSMVEWMSQERQKAFDVKRQHQWHPCVYSLLAFCAQTRCHAERLFQVRSTPR